MSVWGESFLQISYIGQLIITQWISYFMFKSKNIYKLILIKFGRKLGR